jgi:hypothetical protein
VNPEGTGRATWRSSLTLSPTSARGAGRQQIQVLSDLSKRTVLISFTLLPTIVPCDGVAMLSIIGTAASSIA